MEMKDVLDTFIAFDCIARARRQGKGIINSDWVRSRGTFDRLVGARVQCKERTDGSLVDIFVDKSAFVYIPSIGIKHAMASEWECMCDCRSGVHHEKSESDTDTSTENDTSFPFSIGMSDGMQFMDGPCVMFTSIPIMLNSEAAHLQVDHILTTLEEAA